MYVDGVRVGEAAAESPVASQQVQRLCQADGEAVAAGFVAQLPPLPLGKHEVGDDSSK